MKNILPYFFVILMLQISSSVFATDYYSIKNGNASDKNIWNSSRSGNGVTPTNFNDPSDNFIVQQNFSVTNNSNFICKGSLIIETGATYTTGIAGNTTSIGSVVTINEGGSLKLAPKTTLITGFILIQGTLQNLGGDLKFNSAQNAVPVAALTRQQPF